MASPFNAEEIIEIACEVERNGQRFYRRAAELSSDKNNKMLFQELAQMESRHLEDFNAMKGDLEKVALGHADEPAVLYLRAMADGYVFPRGADPTRLLGDAPTLEETLRVAVGLEKDSIVLYLGLRDLVPEELGKKRVDAIIDEEKSHLVTLSGMLAMSSQES